MCSLFHAAFQKFTRVQHVPSGLWPQRTAPYNYTELREAQRAL